MAKSSNLLRRGANWYVRVGVPRPLRQRFGRAEVVRTLGTGDRRQADDAKHAVIAAIKLEFSRVRAGRPPGKFASTAEVRPGEPAWLIDAARQQRAYALQRGESVGEEESSPSDFGMDAAVEHYADAGGDPAAVPTAYRIFAGESALLLSEAVRQHLADLESNVTQAWYNAKERELSSFTKWLRRDIEVRELTRAMGGRYVAETINASGAAPVTRRNRISALVSFGESLVDRGALEANPFSRLTRTVKEPCRGDVESLKREYTPAELLTIFSGLKLRLPVGDPLLSIVAITTYTGMRLEEVCTLRVENIGEDVMRTGGNGVKLKNRSSVRAVPIHPTIAPLVKRLRENSADGWLIPGLVASGTDEKRSHSLSTRYRRWLDRLGLPKQVDAHSLRRSFHQRCEDAGLPEHTINLLVGRKRKGLTFGLYSRGPDWQRLVDAMGKVTYGAEVDGLVAGLG